MTGVRFSCCPLVNRNATADVFDKNPLLKMSFFQPNYWPRALHTTTLLVSRGTHLLPWILKTTVITEKYAQGCRKCIRIGPCRRPLCPHLRNDCTHIDIWHAFAYYIRTLYSRIHSCTCVFCWHPQNLFLCFSLAAWRQLLFTVPQPQLFISGSSGARRSPWQYQRKWGWFHTSPINSLSKLYTFHYWYSRALD